MPTYLQVVSFRTGPPQADRRGTLRPHESPMRCPYVPATQQRKRNETQGQRSISREGKGTSLLVPIGRREIKARAPRATGAHGMQSFSHAHLPSGGVIPNRYDAGGPERNLTST